MKILGHHFLKLPWCLKEVPRCIYGKEKERNHLSHQERGHENTHDFHSDFCVGGGTSAGQTWCPVRHVGNQF